MPPPGRRRVENRPRDPMNRPVLASLLVVALLVLGACSRDAGPAAAAAAVAAPVPDDERMLFLPELMDLVVDPAAGVLFAAADTHAWTHLEPRSDEAWQAVTDAAAQLAQTGAALAEPALARGRADWRDAAAALQDGAAAAGAAARRHDPRGLFAAGLQVRASCSGCHTPHAPHVAR